MATILTTSLGIELRGKSGNAVFVQTKRGIVVRPRVTPRNPRTAAQQASRQRLARASAAWKTLTPAQFAAWKAYAATVTRHHSYGGPAYSPSAHTLFIGLGSKCLQVNPIGEIPIDPPAAPFQGDGIVVSAAGSTGQVTFTASGPNAAHVVTELLLQPLAHGGRAPKPGQYRPQAFVPFAPAALSHPVLAAPGWYACAYRFVHAPTGQEAGILPLGAVLVEQVAAQDLGPGDRDEARGGVAGLLCRAARAT